MKRKLKVFLGGKIDKDNKWRSAIKQLKLHNVSFFDPYKEDWEAEKDIHNEIKAMLSSDLVVFFRGGKLTNKEIDLLKQLEKPRYRTFDSLKTLVQFLVSLDRGKGIGEKKKKADKGEKDKPKK